MNDKLIDINWIEKTQNQVYSETLHKWGKGHDILTELIDLFFYLSHFLNETTDLESDEGAFLNIANSTYLRLPYTLYNIRNLWSHGFYLESIILLRHIVEGFACLRYFSNHKDDVKRHYTAKRSKDRITFKKMFDEVAPEFYEKIYSIFSNFAHGGVITIGTRVNYESPTEGKVYTGCVFNDTYCKIIMDQAPTFSYGYLCYLDQFFPTINSRIPSDVEKILISKKSELRKILYSPRATEKSEESWETSIKPFVEK